MSEGLPLPISKTPTWIALFKLVCDYGQGGRYCMAPEEHGLDAAVAFPGDDPYSYANVCAICLRVLEEEASDE